jgi:hypothetical protein
MTLTGPARFRLQRNRVSVETVSYMSGDEPACHEASRLESNVQCEIN